MFLFMVILIYFFWAMFEYFNLNLIFKFLLRNENESVGIRQHLRALLIVIIISFIFGLSCSGIIGQKVIAIISFLPFYFKMIPILLINYKISRNDILIVLLYQLVISTLSQGLIAVLNLNVNGKFYNLFVSDVGIVVTSVGFYLFLRMLLLTSKTSLLKIYFGDFSVWQLLILGATLCVANIINAEVLVRYTNDYVIKLLSGLNVYIVCILIGWIVFVRDINMRKQVIIEMLDEQVEKMTDYYNDLVNKDIKTHKFMHDINDLIFALRVLVNNEKKKEALDYLDRLWEMHQESCPNYKTGNFLADTILGAKSTVAKNYQSKIVMNGCIPCGIESTDLVIFLANILDNAIEACEKVSGEKEIVVDSIIHKKLWTISVKNPTNGEVNIRNNRILTTKKHKEIHGFGIQNIEKVVEKYCGNLVLDYKEGYFIMRAMLQLNEKE